MKLKLFFSLTNPVDFAAGKKPSLHCSDGPLGIDDWSDAGWYEIDLSLNRDDHKELALSQLEKAEEKEMAEHYKKMEVIRQSREKLLCIEHKPEEESSLHQAKKEFAE